LPFSASLCTLRRVIEPEPLQQVERTYVLSGRRKLAYFSGCDYFRLASHPRVLAALQRGLRRFGLNVAASRLTTGNHHVYQELERRLADFFGTEQATLVASGYLSNLVAAQALARNFSHALLDEESHPSLADAARFLDCPVLQFRHRDAADLAATVRRCGPESKLILLTDGMFSHDGSAAPLAEYLEVLPKDALLLVDDAHGAGVLGEKGRGTPEYAGVGRARVIQTLTLSKAFGVYGGAILGLPALRRQILDRSRLFVASTPLPLPLAAAALESIALVKSGGALRRRLVRNSRYVKNELRAAGFPVALTPGPIIMLMPKSARGVSKLKRALLAAGILPPYIQYPGGPASGYFRFVISSEHSPSQLARLVKTLKNWDHASREP
jgi:8-amino-7-oxononanoate synthase